MDIWICPKCEYSNSKTQTKCMQCNYERSSFWVSRKALTIVGGLAGILVWFLGSILSYMGNWWSYADAGFYLCFCVMPGFLPGAVGGYIGALLGRNNRSKVMLGVFLAIIIAGIGTFLFHALGISTIGQQ